MRVLLMLALASLASVAGTPAHGATYTEDFEAPFPAWQDGWFGRHTDARNANCDDIFGPGTGDCNRGGGTLYLAPTSWGPDLVMTDVRFDPSFGAALRSFSFVATGAQYTLFRAYDSADELVHQQWMSLCCYGQWRSVSFASPKGVSRLNFSVEVASYGAWGVDNLHTTTAVPEPAAWLLLMLGLGAGTLHSRRRLSQA